MDDQERERLYQADVKAWQELRDKQLPNAWREVAQQLAEAHEWMWNGVVDRHVGTKKDWTDCYDEHVNPAIRKYIELLAKCGGTPDPTPVVTMTDDRGFCRQSERDGALYLHFGDDAYDIEQLLPKEALGGMPGRFRITIEYWPDQGDK